MTTSFGSFMKDVRNDVGTSAVRLIQWAVRRLRHLLLSGLVLVAMAVVAVSFSVASFAIPALAGAVSSAAIWAAGSSVMSDLSADNRRLRSDLAVTHAQVLDLNHANDDLNRKNANLRGDLDVSRSNERRLIDDKIRLRADTEALKLANTELGDKLRRQRQAVDFRSGRIERRTARGAALSVAAIPLESVPVLGATTIIATAAWELSDLCQTLQDMNEIRSAFVEEPDRGIQDRVCGAMGLQMFRAREYADMSVPDCREAAISARQRILSLGDGTDLAEKEPLFRQTGFSEEVVRQAEAEFEQISRICNCIADLACDPERLQ